MNVNYTYLVRVDGDTIYADVRNNNRLIGEKKYSTTTYTTDRVTTEVKEEGDKFGFSFYGEYFPPQNNNTTEPEPTNPENLPTEATPVIDNNLIYEINIFLK
jgi:hypothetical protein